MKTSILKRIKGLMSLALCGAMLMGNGMTAAAAAPDYSYECHFFSVDQNRFYNSLKYDCEFPDYNYFLSILDASGNVIYDYNTIEEYGSGSTVIEGGKSFKLNINASDLVGRYAILDDTQTEQFNVYVNGTLVKQISLDIAPGESAANKVETITLGESGSYYIFSFDDSYEKLSQRISEDNSGVFYFKPETESSPFVYNMKFYKVYDANVPAESGTMEYKYSSYYTYAQYSSDTSEFLQYAMPGDTVLMLPVDTGNTVLFSQTHIEVRKYNADMTDYEVVPLSELAVKKPNEYSAKYPSFAMPEGNISAFVTTDEAALQDDYFVSRYSVEAKAATCSESGNVAYLQCPVCEKYYVKEGDSWVEKEEADIFIPASNHANVRKVAAKESTCAATGNIEYYECPDCGKNFKDSACSQELTKAQTVIAKKEHNYVSRVIPASPTAEGSTYKECSRCKVKKDEAVIAKPVVTLKQDILTYNKKVQTAKVVVKDTDGKTIDKSSYTVTYANKKSKAIGQYKVTVKFKGNYDGFVKLTYAIGPKTISLKQGEIGKTSIKLNWTENPSVKGYEIQYSTDKNFKTAVKTVAVSKATKTSVTISNLKAGKTYYFRARTYKTVNKKKVPSVWSKTLKLATKKK